MKRILLIPFVGTIYAVSWRIKHRKELDVWDRIESNLDIVCGNLSIISFILGLSILINVFKSVFK